MRSASPVTPLEIGHGPKRRRVLAGIVIFGLWPMWLPGASAIRPDETVILFPTFGWRTAGGTGWEVSIHGWIGEVEPRTVALPLLRTALRLDGVHLSDEEADLFRARARLFLADNERAKRIDVRVGERTYRLPASGSNGHFSDRIRLGAAEAAALPRDTNSPSSRVRVEAVPPRRDQRRFVGEAHLLEETGWSVVSDIDDTIKVTEVSDHEAMLRNTFCRPFRAVPGMAEFFQALRRQQGAAFHYVSASPWQLYPDLAAFVREQGFPAGTVHLSLFRWKDESVFNLLKSPEDFKLATITPLLERFPRRRFVMVGDSGQKDPEIYGHLARRFPQQIAHVLIREVPGGDNTSERFGAAFADVPSAKWKTFRQPAELQSAVR